jgi:hypothetical protein
VQITISVSPQLASFEYSIWSQPYVDISYTLVFSIC